MTTSWPFCTSSRAPAGVSATRYSSVLISLATPILTARGTIPDVSVRKPGFRIGSSFRVAWSPDGRRLLTLGRRVAIWDVETRRRVADVKPFSYESSVAVSPAGDRFAVKNTQGTVAVVDLTSALVRL